MPLTDTVNFDLIRYASCWEDADVLLQALAVQPGERVLSIASAGDNSLSLLSEGPSLVCAVDLSQPQLYLAELKRTAFAQLTYSDMLMFLGFAPSDHRWKRYRAIRSHLSKGAQTYWDQHRKVLEAGVIFEGKLEKYFRLFRRWVLPLIHRSGTVKALLAEKDDAKQAVFYDRRWNTWRWRALFRVFFSRAVMGRAGRDPEFLRQVTGPVYQQILTQVERCLRDPAVSRNYMVHQILTGEYGQWLPHYARARNFESIRRHLHALELRQGDIQTIASATGPINAFNLSDIFEYMDEATFATVSRSLYTSAAPGARFAYWNLMVPRCMSDIWPDALAAEPVSPTTTDTGFFYQAFHRDVKSEATHPVSSSRSNHAS